MCCEIMRMGCKRGCACLVLLLSARFARLNTHTPGKAGGVCAVYTRWDQIWELYCAACVAKHISSVLTLATVQDSEHAHRCSARTTRLCSCLAACLDRATVAQVTQCSSCALKQQQPQMWSLTVQEI